MRTDICYLIGAHGSYENDDDFNTFCYQALKLFKRFCKFEILSEVCAHEFLNDFFLVQTSGLFSQLK